MKKVIIEFSHCYGINHLSHTFDFSEKSAALVYAANGVMKTSFAKTFKDLSKEIEPQDRIYTDRPTSCSVKLEDGSDIEPASIFVVEPYDPAYSSDKVSSLLVNRDLK